MKRISFIFVTFILAVSFLLPTFVLAVNNAESTDGNLPTIYFFRGEGCPHCEKEEEFFEKLKNEYFGLQIKDFEVWHNRDNAKLLQKVAKELDIKSSGVPVTIISDQVVIGFGSEASTGRQIKRMLQTCIDEGCNDFVESIITGENGEKEKPKQERPSKIITLPIIGEIDTKNWSLPVLTIVIGGLDGFNPCAMWVLIFLISLLLGMEDKRKMWILGSSFIIASATVYFLFLAAWLNLFLFLGFIVWIRFAIGAVAIGSGVYHLREWYVNKSGLCKVTGQERKQKIMNKFKKVAEEKKFWLALVGIISIAIAVNLIELVCSAGLPAIYTQILALAGLSTPAYYLYLLLYIFVFMLDDLVVFIIAMTTLQAVGLSGKYSRWSSLIGGIVIFILGLLLILKPGWVMFG